MRIYTDTLTADDVTAAATSRGMRRVVATLEPRGARKRARAFDVHLTGTSSRRPNDGHGNGSHAGYAATWDEWGMFLATLYEADPDMIAHPYTGAAHFHAATCGRFATLTAPYQHGGGGHRWQYVEALERHVCDCGAELGRLA